MLLAISALKGYTIEASDGVMGSVGDLLFDDKTWRVRWLVIDTGGWLSARQVLLHPSSVGQTDFDRSRLLVKLTKSQVERSPDLLQGQPVSQSIEDKLYSHYGWDPLWGGGGYLGPNSALMESPMGEQSSFGLGMAPEAADVTPEENDPDPGRRSVVEVTGYHVRATDGDIGHIENFIMDSDAWTIRYLIVATRNWWPGQHVLISPAAVQQIEWIGRHAQLNVSRDQVKASPPWDPLAMIDQAYVTRLHGHYRWPLTGY
jgi:sporulation protein YlmC with PRC-barrel domain